MDSAILPNCSRLRLAVGAKDGSVSLLAIRSDRLETLYCVELENTVPAAIAFYKLGAPYLGVFCRNGHVIKLHCDTGAIISRHDTGSDRIGYAALGTIEGKEVYVIDNTIDGYDLFNIDDCSWRMWFQASEPEQRMPNIVTFAEEGALVIGGSNQDQVYIYDTLTGTLKDTLEHKGWGMTQVVTARSVDRNTHLIAVGQSGRRGYIGIWKRTVRPQWITKQLVMETLLWALWWAGRILCGLLAAFCLYQNKGEYLPRLQDRLEEIGFPVMKILKLVKRPLSYA